MWWRTKNDRYQVYPKTKKSQLFRESEMEGFPYLTATLIDHQILMPLLNFRICIICMICTLKLCTKSINRYWIRRFRTILPDGWRGRTISVYFHFTLQVNTIVQASLEVFLAVQDSSITDIVCRSVGPLVPWSQLTIRAEGASKSDPRH